MTLSCLVYAYADSRPCEWGCARRWELLLMDCHAALLKIDPGYGCDWLKQKFGAPRLCAWPPPSLKAGDAEEFVAVRGLYEDCR